MGIIETGLSKRMLAPVGVGTRVYTNLYSRGRGVIYAVHGEPSPASIQTLAGGAVVMGGRATFDIVFECGEFAKQLPESILAGCGWKILDEPAAELPEIQAYVAQAKEEDAKRAAAAAEADRLYKGEVARLKADPKWAHLTQVGQYSGSKEVAVNLRAEFKKLWPKVKFTVRKDGYDTVRVGWTDGPTTAEVKAVTGKYESGYFDGMDDCYHYSKNAFGEVFGDCRYVFENRSHSVEQMREAVAAVAFDYGWKPEEIPEIGTYSDGEAYIDCRYNDNQRLIYAWLEKTYPYEVKRHTQDSDCTVDPETGLCTVCGVLHGEPCILCGGRGYHALDCAELDPIEVGEPANAYIN